MEEIRQTEDLIFSLDIGTRTVVGIVGKMVDEMFHIIDHEVIPHSKRSMMDGQIEDIDEVAKVVGKVKGALEKRKNTQFTNVAIAAAGRSLKTERIAVEIEISTNEPISEELAQSFEMEAISTAQQKVDELQKETGAVSFYCVGYNIIEYQLDGYPIKTIKGHRGKKVQVDVIAAFLPSMVVESLYAVMEKNDLEVSSLTLEPIAAMNVIVPPEVRLINIALVDIGAGTSDIAISQNGSIVAYAMATIAGDEITEEIIKHFLVDFETAEQMKLSAGNSEISYKNILGLDYTISQEEFYEAVYPSVDALADSITQTIMNINGGEPAAVFLVGGGSLAPKLPKLIADKLGIAQTRIAVSGSNYIKSVMVSEDSLVGPAFVTPIGIGVTSVIDKGYDFSNIFLNEKKFKIFDTKNLKVFDVLLKGGYKTNEILGRLGAELSYTLNGEKVVRKGAIGKPALITLNGKATTLNSAVNKGDKIEIVPAVSGATLKVTLFDLVKNLEPIIVKLDEKEYSFEPMISVNEEQKEMDYQIEDGDYIEVKDKFYLSELIEKRGMTEENVWYLKDGRSLERGYVLGNQDVIISTTDFIKSESNETDFTIFLNEKEVILPKKKGDSPHILLETLNYIEIDSSHPVGLTDVRLNGESADFTSEIKANDKIEIILRGK